MLKRITTYLLIVICAVVAAALAWCLMFWIEQDRAQEYINSSFKPQPDK